jgi:tetratricopeptide (TPR) repeat protein
LRRTLGLIASSCLLLVSASVTKAADEGAVLSLRAEQMVANGDCAGARDLLRRARSADPQDSRAALLQGLCAIRAQDYAAAIPPLTTARELDPSSDDAVLYLGIAQYQLGDRDAAAETLDEAVKRQPDNAEAQLFYGMSLLQRARGAEAAAALEQARSLDPGQVDPAASYFAGRAWQVAEDRDRAEAALERTIAQAPGTPWAEEAQRALDGERSRYRPRGFWGRLTAGMEYDSNVVLEGGSSPVIVGISDEDDGRGAWYARGGAELLRGPKWAAGAVVNYYGNAHFDLDRFDTQFPGFGVYLDHSLGERSYLRFEPDFAYGWVDYDDYVLVAGSTLSFHHDFEDAGVGRAWFRFEHRDYLFSSTPKSVFSQGAGGPPYPLINRDGQNYLGGYDHSFEITDTTKIRGTAGAQYYDADRGQYRYVSPVAIAGFTQKLPWESTFDFDFLYKHEFYDDKSGFSFPTNPKDRDDDFYQVALVLEKRFTDHLLASIRYSYSENDSPVKFFDYDRHIAGAFVTIEFGPGTGGPREDLGRTSP